jgi:hypothetical protein
MSGALRTDEVVWSRSPRRWDQVSQAVCEAMVANKPGHQGEHEAAVNTIAQGMSMLRLTRGELARVLSTFAYEAMGAAETPGIPCALHFLEGRRCYRLGRNRAAGVRTRVLAAV